MPEQEDSAPEMMNPASLPTEQEAPLSPTEIAAMEENRAFMEKQKTLRK